MLIRTMDQLEAQGRVVSISHGNSSAVRLLTKSDGVGFSVSEARASAGKSSDLWYKNHWEANLILDGTLDVTDHASGDTHRLEPGALYLVGPADRHRIEAADGVHLISVFNPPLTGSERHDEDGGYPPTGPIPPGPARAQDTRLAPPSSTRSA